MASDLKSLTDAAFALPPDEQVTLLLALLGRVSPTRSDEELLSEDLKAELDKRIRFCEEHPELLIPAEDAHKRIRAMLRQRRAS